MIYMLKLAHLVEDKIHARVDRPVQPGHPAAAGRQGAVRRPAIRRDGGVGARGVRRRHVLQEILTVKSDDIVGRVKAYEAIVKGDNTLEAGIPESFRVLVKELEGLALGVEILSEDEHQIVLSRKTSPRSRWTLVSASSARRDSGERA